MRPSSPRTFIAGLGSAAAWPVVARAQAYPTRPVRIVVGFPPGGGADIVSRLIGQWLSERLSQQFVIENRPGAASNIAAEAVVRAPADGYTLLTISPANAISATLYGNVNFNFIRDIAPVAGIMRVPLIIVVQPSFPAKTVLQFIAYAKANPGRINMASPGNGTANHLSGELFKMMAGINMLHVPYRGAAPAIADLLGGQVQVMIDNGPSSIEYIRMGKLRALAVTTATRWEALPDVPTVADFLPGYESSTWNGFGAPRNTPTEIIAKLNNEINAALADPKIRTRLANLGGAPLSMTPVDLASLVHNGFALGCFAGARSAIAEPLSASADLVCGDFGRSR
jgi:tripartite-type tricarboxylate transporter receptor subunit TctC